MSFSLSRYWVHSRERQRYLLDFSICILGYSQNRPISLDCIQNENVSLQFPICWSKLNHIPYIKRFEIPVHKLTADFFSYLRNRVCSIFSVAGKFCLAHGLRQLTCDVKNDIRTINFRNGVTFAPLRKTRNDVRKRSLCDVIMSKIEK